MYEVQDFPNSFFGSWGETPFEEGHLVVLYLSAYSYSVTQGFKLQVCILLPIYMGIFTIEFFVIEKKLETEISVKKSQ